MFILIDGYNLLHEVGFRGDLSKPGNLEKARIHLLEKIATYLSPVQRAKTLVIFDAGRRSRSRGEKFERHGIQVEFAYDFNDADEMIEELIRKHSVPNQLMVVSSDHRIQKAARTRSCQYMDSDAWIDVLESGRHPDSQAPSQTSSAPNKPTLREPPEFWMALFDIEEIEEIISGEDEGSEEDQKNEVDYDEYDIFPDGFGDELG